MGWVWGFFAMPGAYNEIVHAYTTFAITLALSFLVYSFDARNFARNLKIIDFYGLISTSGSDRLILAGVILSITNTAC
jgi:hypothetical protein